MHFILFNLSVLEMYKFQKKNSSERINNRMYTQLVEATHHKIGGSGFEFR